MEQEKISVSRFDRSVVKKAEITDEGYLKADAIVTRTGVFNYINNDGTIRRELRHPDDVLVNDSLNSLKMRPITNGHPSQKIVKADNAKDLTIGYTGETVNVDGQYIITSLMITDRDGVQQVKSGRKKELSLGYTVDLLPEEGVYNGESYTHRQTNIKYNHLAIVEQARAGNQARIHLDHGEAECVYICDNEYNQIKENNVMSEEKFSVVSLDGIDYKAAPEVVNAYKKSMHSNQELSDKLDSLNDEIEKIKAERDSIKEKYDEAINVDHEAKVRELVKSRVSLINNAEKILGNKSSDLNMDEMSDKDIMIQSILHRKPNANLDQSSDVYIQARFDALVEDIDNYSDSNIANQREKVSPKLDSNNNNSADEARKRMIDRMRNRYKDNKKNKNIGE